MTGLRKMIAMLAGRCRAPGLFSDFAHPIRTLKILFDLTGPNCTICAARAQSGLHSTPGSRLAEAPFGRSKNLPIDLRTKSPVGIFTLKNRTLSPVVQLIVEEARSEAKLLTDTRTRKS